LKVNQIMELFFLFNNDASTNFLMNTKGYSSATISKWFKVYMDILINDFSFSQVKIGGEHTVEFKVSLDWLMKQSTILKILLNQSL